MTTPNSKTIGRGTNDPKQHVVALLEAIAAGDTEALGVIDVHAYTQHNLNAEDGLEGLKKLMRMLPKGSVKADVVRVFQDGDYVVAHSDYEFFGPKAGFDIFRFQDGKIVEHWDNLQEKASTPNPSGRTMLDGSTTITDREKTDENKRLVRAFFDEVMMNGKMDRLASYFDGNRYIQHTPTVADGLSGLMTAMQQMVQAGITVKYDRIHTVLGEGNFVLVVSEGSIAGQPTSFYDLVRIENGTIAEHWDVVETIPPKSQWKNQNGKFGFDGLAG
jgi:predicted SnoaL-like aldol condensation-catalyzing enzyme